MAISKKDLLDELIKKQRKNIPNEVLLGYKDLNRFVDNIDNSIFGLECTLWKGFIHSYKNNYYINFYFKGSKKNLSRLLYYNFVGKLENNEYIKNICKNNGKCCNITHYKKFRKDNNYNSDDEIDGKNNDGKNNDEINDNINNNLNNKLDNNNQNIDDFKIIF